MTTSKSSQNLSGEPRKSKQAKNGGGGALAGSNTAAHVISGSDGIVNGVDKVGGASSVAAISGILNGVIGNSNGEVTIEIKTSVMTDLVHHFRELTVQNNSLISMQRATSEKLLDALKRLEQVESELKKLQSNPDQLSVLKNRVEELDKSVDAKVNAMSSRAGSSLSFSDLFTQRSSTDSSETAKVVHELHNAVARESQDRANREFNLIVSGTEANRQTDAEQQVKKILQTIGFQSSGELQMLKSVHRFKPMSSGEKSSLIKIQLSTRDDRYKIIKQAKELKKAGDEFKSIYLHFDLSPSQRYKRKLLVDECKLKNENNKDKTNKIFVIRNDTVKLINRN
jgi:cell division septum initiation protein DivIVA